MGSLPKNESKLSLRTSENSISEVNDLCFLNEPVKSFDEGQMRRIALYIIVSICGACKLYDKGMCDSILSHISKVSSEYSVLQTLRETYLDALGGVILPTRRRFDIGLL